MDNTALLIAKESAGREIFWNVPAPYNQILMYLLLVPTLAILGWGLWRRFELWSAGTAAPDRLTSWGPRFIIFWDYVVRQRGTNREPQARIFHSLILWGFIILLFTTTMVFIDQDLGIPIYRGRFYLAVTLLSDIFGLLFLVGIMLAIHRRFIARPDKLHNAPADWFMLGLLALLIFQGFGLEGLRIAATNDPWRAYSPVGYGVSLLFWPLSVGGLKILHFALWWFHTITVFVFFALLPYSKFLHILSSSANLFFRNIERPKGTLSFPGDIVPLVEAAESSGEFKVGLATLPDLSWKTRLDLDACTSCGRCQEVCPAYNSGKVLSPKWLILDLRNHMLTLQVAAGRNSTRGGIWGKLDRLDAFLLDTFLLKPSLVVTNATENSTELAFRAKNSLVQNSFKELGRDENSAIAGGVLEEDVVWSCTTCRACEEVCPVGIEHVDLIMDVRRSMTLMEGNLPAEAQNSLRAIETRGNPFGDPAARMSWAEGLNVPVLSEGDQVDILYWAGCISAYDRRKQAIARSMVNILNAAGVSWGMLGTRGSCTGDPARRLGEENLFQSQAKKNLATLSGVKFKTLVANCPHCFNTLKNEYPDVDAEYRAKNLRVVHHSHLIQEFIAEGRLSLNSAGLSDEEITFHDPCYLGRYSDTYQEPREVLVQLGAKPREMASNQEKSMCCGAGGGHFWMDLKVGERINKLRVDEAADTSAKTIATACPFCLQMLEDGVKLTDREGQIKVLDLAELVAAQLH